MLKDFGFPRKIKIWDGTKFVTITTDGLKERLDVNIQDGITATITDNDSPTKYQLKSIYNTVGKTLNISTDTELFSITGQGVIDLVAVNSLTSSNWEVVIIIDGEERIRIPMNDLGSKLGLTNSDYAITTETANKQFRYHPAQIGFTSSFVVKARSTVGTPKVNYLSLYRQKVVT